MAQETKSGKQLLDQKVVSKSGKLFGRVADIIFEVKSGELIHLVLKEPTEYARRLDLEHDSSGKLLLPFSAVVAMEDFLIVSEEDII
jgi:sporulation protein YlmC with PRC-barrel domain